MRKNQKGFSALEMLIVLIVICLLATTGWYVYQSRHKTKQTSGVTSSYKVNKVIPPSCDGNRGNNCPAPVDTIDANLKILSQSNKSSNSYYVVTAKITKIINYQRVNNASYPAYQVNQTIDFQVVSTNICPKDTTVCSAGYVDLNALPSAQVSSIIKYLIGKTVAVKNMHCNASCDGDISGLINN